MNTHNLIITRKVLGFIMDSDFLVEAVDEWLVSWAVVFLIHGVVCIFLILGIFLKTFFVCSLFYYFDWKSYSHPYSVVAWTILL